MDLLSNLDAARSAGLRRRAGGDREISTDLVAMHHQLRTVALAPGARTNRLRTVFGRNGKPHHHCVRLAIPADRYRHGRAADLRS